MSKTIRRAARVIGAVTGVDPDLPHDTSEFTNINPRRLAHALADAGMLALAPSSPPAPYELPRRLLSCIEEWPDCEDDAYNPLCCRFPKRCSCLADPHTPDEFAEPRRWSDGVDRSEGGKAASSE